MKYWDSSSIIPLLVEEDETKQKESLLREDPQIITWWGSRIECASALNRLYREGSMDDESLQRTLSDLETFASSWLEVQPVEKVRRRALRLLRLHQLRAADALQLAASLVAADENPSAISFVSSDQRLTQAAGKEGFTVIT
ncbi:MAG: type II toxin-antitoxin system VapC family toxin [Spirochaetota bacterium]